MNATRLNALLAPMSVSRGRRAACSAMAAITAIGLIGMRIQPADATPLVTTPISDRSTIVVTDGTYGVTRVPLPCPPPPHANLASTGTAVAPRPQRMCPGAGTDRLAL